MRKFIVMLLVVVVLIGSGIAVEASPSEPAAPPQPWQGHAACAGVTLENPSTPGVRGA